MTNTNMRNTNTEVTYIHINDIIKRDGAAGKLFRDIGAVHDDGASLEEIQELEKELAELEAKQPDYQYISIMKEWLEEARESAEDWDTYEAIKAETIASTDDEDLAEDIAWELVYSNNNEISEKSPAIGFSKFPKAYKMIHVEATEEQQTTGELNSTIKVFA